MLFFIGRMIEARWGWKTLIEIYILSGLFTSATILLVQWSVGLFFTPVLNMQYLSSWGATIGLFSFIAFLFPQQQITIFLYFIPVRVKMRNLLWILIGIEAISAIFNIISILISPSYLSISFPQSIGNIAGVLGAFIIFRLLRRNL